MTAYYLLKALHVLCAVLWVGGMFFAIIVLRPSLAVLEPAQRIALHEKVFRRFFLIVWHVMPGIIVSGYAIIAFFLGGMAGTPWPIHAMTTLGMVMGAIFLWIYFMPYRQFRTAAALPVRAAAADRIRQLVTLNLILGVVTVVVAHLR
jgi:uncharacterized membrane protein